ncbi:hypothetical protein K466DRAFT_667427 [Polyporus arcularius HHB13444]|uniref:Ribosomal protein S21 n=1 Tax=Polyporus arcularius HHB13444 TaxID=1314778 RepID=A0A5C3NX65_9APHY|nr:hypothetical protein K466DRAFT_667427 [Polyporus arcularius HHB13444]
MLPVGQFAATALRQCSRHSAVGIAVAHRFRSVSTGSSFASAPNWIDRNNKLGSKTGTWDHILGITNIEDARKTRKQTPETIWDTWEKQKVAQLPRPHTPYSGRSVSVEKGDVHSALVKLKGILTINAVRYTHVRDERHEKKGEKRNRLKSQRWRRRFAHEVRKKVQLVNEIRARGA